MKAYYKKIVRFYRFLKKTKKVSGKSFGFLWNDFMYLKKRIKLAPEEYFDFEFDKKNEEFRETFLTEIEKTRYIRLLNPKKYYILARNKYLAHLYLDAFGLRKAKLYCYYHPEGRFENENIGGDYNSVLNILRAKDVKSCVVKTTESSHGDGVVLINNIDYVGEECILYRYDGEKVDLRALLKYEPLIFEEAIIQTNQFQQFNQSSINTVRFMTTLYPDGNAYIIAIWMKFGRNGSCVDNAGSGGNVDAAVDVKTGKIYNVTLFDGWRKTKLITHHPDSGTLLEGVVIENWEKITADIISFQKAMPFNKAIGWDIAITETGPVVVEMNDNWEATGQLFIGRGWKKEIRDCYFAWEKLVDIGLVSYHSGRGIDPIKSELFVTKF